MKIRVIFLLFGLISVWQISFSQVPDSTNLSLKQIQHYLLERERDTNYVTDYGRMVGVRFLVMNKSNNFAIHDRDNFSSIRYRPAPNVYIGIGLANKAVAADFTLSVGGNDDEQPTASFDFQGKVFTSKHYLAATLQYYRNYRLVQQAGLSAEIPEELENRSDIRTTNFELAYLYTTNYTKFSFKAPFVFNDLQKKSAGSPLVGVNYSMFSLYSDSSLLPPSTQPDFVPDANLTNLSIVSLGIDAGYMYTFVARERYFLTVSLIPGLHYNVGDYATDQLHRLTGNLNLKFNTLNAIGYNGDKFYGGLYFFYNSQFNRVTPGLYAEVGYSKFAAFVGYRFKVKKFFRR